MLDNEAGALSRVVEVFSSRGYNIHSLTVAELCSETKISRITITTSAPLHVIRHMVTLLERLIPVYKVRDLTSEGPRIEKGLLLIKLRAEGTKRQELLHLAQQFEALQVDTTETSFVFQLTDIPSKLNEFVDVMSAFEIIEMSRTGVTAMARGAEPFMEMAT